MKLSEFAAKVAELAAKHPPETEVFFYAQECRDYVSDFHFSLDKDGYLLISGYGAI